MEQRVKPTGAMRRLARDIRRQYALYLMIIPVLAGFILFKYVPMYGVVMAFQNYDFVGGFFSSPIVGLKWFTMFFQDPYFFRLVRNTFLIGLYGLLWGFWPPILLAILLNEIRGRTFKRVVQSISYLPHFIATVVIVGMMMEMLSTFGVVNDTLERIGLHRLAFFADPRYFRSLYIGSDIWQSVGWGSILYLAALTGIDPELYDAAAIDGAGRLQRIRHITLPGLLPTIQVVLIFSVSDITKVGLEKVYLMQNPGIYQTADVVATYVYRRGLLEMNFSYGAAIGLIENIVALVLLLLANFASRRLTQRGLW
jgi:putative aldouronate transport system permease protein